MVATWAGPLAVMMVVKSETVSVETCIGTETGAVVRKWQRREAAHLRYAYVGLQHGHIS